MSTKSERAEDARWRRNHEYVMECPTTGCDYKTPAGPVREAEQALKRHRTEEQSEPLK